MVAECGGELIASVRAGVTILLVGSNPRQRELQWAAANGVPRISERGLRLMHSAVRSASGQSIRPKAPTPPPTKPPASIVQPDAPVARGLHHRRVRGEPPRPEG